jgi:hypothetical protein
MASKATKLSSANRKPSLSRIKDTERKMLLWEGKGVFYGNKIKETESRLNDLGRSNVRLKITERVKLTKLLSKLKQQHGRAELKVKYFDGKLKVYSAVKW